MFTSCRSSMAFFVIVAVLVNIYSVQANNLDDGFSEINSPTYFANKLLENLEVSDLDISKQCEIQVSHYASSLLNKPRAQWAVQMFDAVSKLPSGLYSGNLVDLGFFDQCINIHNSSAVTTIDGKYCLGTMPLSVISNQITQANPKVIMPGTDLYIATCLPSACSATDVEKIYRKLKIPLRVRENRCQTKADWPELDGGDIAMISFLAVMCFFMLASTAYDVILLYSKKDSPSSILLAFSVYTNGKKLISTTSGKSDQISCIHGLRVITMMWIIMGHKYGLTSTLPMRNNFYIIDFMLEPANMFLRNANFSVDTFLLLGGIVIVYTFMSAVKKGTKFNIIVYYIHRYLRLTPLLAVAVAFILTLMKHLGSGPVWPESVNLFLIDNCKTNWWRSLLYIQNLDSNGRDICIQQSWYLGVDFQLFLISPILLLPLKKWPRMTLILTGSLIACSTLTAFLTTWFLELESPDSNSPDDFQKYYYNAPWIRCTPWLIGILVGYLIFQVKQNKTQITINKILVLVLWGISLVLLYVCVFEGYDLKTGNYDRLTYSFYLALLPPTWALAVGWVVFACVIDCGGPINWFLSMPVFQVLSKLTYCIFIIHTAVIVITDAQTRSPTQFSHSEIMHAFWGDYMLMVAISFVSTLAFESPVITFEKFLFHRNRKESKS